MKLWRNYLCVLLVTAAVLASGVASADSDYENKNKKFSPYPTWHISELRYRFLRTNSETAKETRKQRICIEGEVTEIGTVPILGDPYIWLYEKEERGFFEGLLEDVGEIMDFFSSGFQDDTGSSSQKVMCYFSRKEEIDRYHVGDKLVIEGRIMGEQSLNECKVVAKYRTK